MCIYYQEIAKMATKPAVEKAELFSKLILSNDAPRPNSETDNLDWIFGFQTVFYTCPYSYRCCGCAFEHEYFTYISDTPTEYRNISEIGTAERNKSEIGTAVRNRSEKQTANRNIVQKETADRDTLEIEKSSVWNKSAKINKDRNLSDEGIAHVDLSLSDKRTEEWNASD